MDAWRRRKEEAGVLDFSDLEERARDLLRGHAGIRELSRGRFRQVLVDEVQDVNPLQEEIIRLVSPEGGRFSVGDEKQSIYGFRNADPTLLREVARGVGPEGLRR